MLITGRGTESSDDLFYSFHDPATSHPEKGGDVNVANRFYLNSNGKLFRPASTATQIQSAYDVSMVRRNV